MSVVCQAKSNRAVALGWTTIAFFAGFAGVSAFGPIVPSIKTSLGLNPVEVGFLAAAPILAGALQKLQPAS